jgi:response regulator RpfG family c-di-GMP phosphodiesterase
MENLPVVVLAGHNTLVNSRIKNVFANQNIKICEAYNRRELFRILYQNNNVALILTEIEIDAKNSFDGINLIRQVKAKRSSIPVVVLTSIGKKEVITGCLREGAADYILKPFKDDYLKEKLLKYVDLEKLTESTVLHFNLKDFLASEIHKAKKGTYCFSLLKVKFDSGTEEEGAIQSFHQYEESIYSEMKSLFWESDIYIQHGYQCHLGFFPFCDQTNRKLIIDKIESRFQDYKIKEPNTKDYSITYTFTSYPADGETVSELLRNLSVNIKTNQKTA